VPITHAASCSRASSLPALLAPCRAALRRVLPPARLGCLQVHRGRLEGGEVQGRVYRPVIRTEPRGRHATVTWAEFVEAGLLREYRQTHRIPMAELRAFIDQVRSEFGVPYPLADQRPFTSGKELLSVAVARVEGDVALG
jgi:hypothetical protein